MVGIFILETLFPFVIVPWKVYIPVHFNTNQEANKVIGFLIAILEKEFKVRGKVLVQIVQNFKTATAEH